MALFFHKFDYLTITYHDLLQAAESPDNTFNQGDIIDPADLLDKLESRALDQVRSQLRNYFDLDLIFLPVYLYDSEKTYATDEIVAFNVGTEQAPTWKIVVSKIDDNLDNAPYAGDPLAIDSDSWKADDPRSQEILQILEAFVLGALLKRIGKESINNFRSSDLKYYRDRLKSIASLELNVDLPRLDTDDQKNIKPYIFSETKQNWRY